MTKMPNQKVSTAAKTPKFFEESAVAALTIALNDETSIKPLYSDIQENFKIFNGERSPDEMKKRFDMTGILGAKYSPSFRNYSTIKDVINVLVGEYIERGEDYVIAALDRDSVTSKIKEHKDRMYKAVMKLVNDEQADTEEKIQAKLAELVDFKFMSKLEYIANRILTACKRYNKLEYTRIDAFREALITAGIIFRVEPMANKIKVKYYPVDSVFVSGMGNSNNIKDADIIAAISYQSPTSIIDTYSEFMKKEQVDKVARMDINQYYDEELTAKKQITFRSKQEMEFFTRSITGTGTMGIDVVDSYGNVRVADVVWKGYRMYYKRKYYDELNRVQYDYVSEKYKADKDKGETLQPVWVAEYHSAKVIGADIVVDAKICDYNYIDVNYPNRNISGFVGGYFNVGNERAKSMIDDVKNYLYARDEAFAKLEDLLNRNMGKVVELDLATIPDGWDVQKVLYWLKAHGILVKNSTKEIDKGRSKGKLAGTYTPGTRSIDAELGISIQSTLSYINLLDTIIARTTGVTDQRLGAINSRELVGNVERSRIQSSLITEYWFNKTERFVLDLYDVIIEMSKKVYNKDTTLQYVLDDMSYSILDEDLSAYPNSHFGLFPVNMVRYNKLKQLLESTMGQAFANGQISSSNIISLYTAQGMSELVETQEKIDKETKKAKQEEAKIEHERAVQIEQMRAQAEKEKLDAEHAFQLALNEMNNQTKIKVEGMKIENKEYLENLSMSMNALIQQSKEKLEEKKIEVKSQEANNKN